MSAGRTLLEREQDLDVLSGALAGIGSDGGRVVLVRGEAGIGKSALVRGFLEVHVDEADVLFGSCDDLLTPQPLGPFWDIARQEPPLLESLDNGDRPAVLAAAVDLLTRPQRSTVLVIEDTHWADEATLDAIRYLGRRINTANGLLVLTYRDEEVDFDHPLRGVLGDLPPESVVRIKLGGLSREAVSSLATGSGLDAGQVFEATDGNPLLVTEMASVGGGTVPASVQDSVMARVAKLTTEAHEALRILSVIPERVPTAEISELVGETAGWLAECEQRGLLEVDGGFTAFRHGLIRRAVQGSLTGSERVAINTVVLQSLPEDTDPARMVHHASEANDIAALVKFAPAAAQAAVAVGSHREAVEHFRQLTPFIDRLAPDVKGPILDSWAQEERVRGHVSEAIRVNETARAHYRRRGDQVAESAAMVHEAQLYHWDGQRDRASQLAREAIDILGPDPAGLDLARALDVNALLAAGHDIDASLELVERALEAAGPDADEYLLIRYLASKGCADHIADYPEGRASLEEATQRAQTIGDWYEACRALLNHSLLAIEFRDLPTAADLVQEAIALAVHHEQRRNEYSAEAAAALLLELKAEWEQAEDLAREHFHDAVAMANMVTLPVICVIEARKGRPGAAASLRQAWEITAGGGEVPRQLPVAAAVAEHAWICGQGVVLISDITSVMEAGIDMGLKWSSGSIAMWLWKLGELDAAPDGIAEPYRLVIEGEPIAAAELWVEIGCPYERAIALSHGDTAARLEALEIIETLGATAVAAKLRQQLRDDGIAVPRGRSPKTRDHGAGLTARQAEILSLLAEELSNAEIADRLFLSPRTVEHHVAAVMSKLDATTRDQAVTTAADQGLLASR